MWPLDEVQLFSRARPYSESEPDRIVTVECMCNILDEKSRLESSVLLDTPQVLKLYRHIKGSISDESGSYGPFPRETGRRSPKQCGRTQQSC